MTLKPHPKKLEDGKQMVKCDECEYEASTDAKLKFHKKIRHSDNDYVCHECGYVTKSFYGFRDHKRSQHSGILVYCDLCDYTAKRKRALKIHKLTKHSNGENFLFCELCTYKTPLEKRLHRHISVHHSNDPLLCEQCDFKTVLQKKLDEHVLTEHQGFMYECEHCDYKCTSSYLIKKHQKVVHDGRIFLCDSCDFKSTERSHLTRHVAEKHEGKKYFCDLCDYQATRPERLKRHVRATHEGIVHQCNICETKYKRKDKLNKHMRDKHSDMIENFPLKNEGHVAFDFNVKPTIPDVFTQEVKEKHDVIHQCNICQTTLRRRDKMNKHLREKHPDDTMASYSTIFDTNPPKNRPACSVCGKVHSPVEDHFDCDLCTEKFSTEGSLNQHKIRTHKIEQKHKPKYDASNPLHCHTCKKAIQSENYLIYHMDTQHVQKTEFYNCRFCNYKVKVKYPHSLLEHLRTHTGERPEKCTICGQCFKTKKTLTNHHKTHVKKQFV